MTKKLVDRLRDEMVEQSSRCGEEDSQDRALLAEEAANEIERLLKREKDLMDVIDSRDRALGFVPLDEVHASEPCERRCDCWERISALIVKGPLEGDGWDPTAQRNGIILAANHIAPFNRPAAQGASRDASSKPSPAFMYCPKCGELYTGRGGTDGFPMTLTCPNQHSWTDPRPTELRT